MSIGLEFRPNRLYYGDCLAVLREWPAQCVDLVYLDPPFNSKANYNVLYGSKNGASAQLRAFSDTWHWDEAAARRMEGLERAPARRSHAALTGLRTILGESGMLAYLSYMAERLEQCRRVLHDHGSLYLHCDPTASHYLKLLLDAVFGRKAFRNEIVWKRQSSHNRAKRWGPIHDCLLYFAGPEATWNRVLQPLEAGYRERFYRYCDERGKYQVGDLTGPGPRDGDTGQPWRSIDPSAKGRHWELPPDRALPPWFHFPSGYSAMLARQRLDVLDKQGLIYWPARGKMPRFKRYLTPASGAPVTDIVLDIPPLGAASKERLGYPTQKPVALLTRIIEASSNPGDIVLDPFCGCGTTIAAADLAKRQWVGIDVSPFAVKLVRDRRLGPMGRTTEIAGIPTDMEGARMLLERNAFDFEAWAVTSIPGLAPNERQVGDRGIDGRGAMMHPPDGTESRLVVAQVKGGGYTASSMRDFQRVIERENAAAGVYITLERVQARNARQATSELGTFTIGAQRYPKLQLWSIEELLDDREPHLPDMADPYTGERIRQAELFGNT